MENIRNVSLDEKQKESIKSVLGRNTTVRQNKSYTAFSFVKRLGDVLISSIALVLLLPVFVIVAILIKKENPKAPIFFLQTRVGKDEKLFVMYKFRSMCVDAEEKLSELSELNEIEGAMFKIKEDPRVTSIGKLIRRTSIDELPQLVNVLRGEMSLVGPRPPLEREVDKYSEYDKQRLVVKPGCTGLWQISGRNNVGFKEMVELDLEYIKKASILMDSNILLKTISVVLCLNSSNGH